MASLKIVGGNVLKGTIVPQGAKNEALQVICATLLTTEPVIIHNIPDILDVHYLFQMLKLLDVNITNISPKTYQLQAVKINKQALESDDFQKKYKKIRGSIMLLAPLLIRLGIVALSQPGGDKIGRRSLQVHLDGMKKLGAHYTYDAVKQTYILQTTTLQGNYILLEEASVTGTANILMAAVLAQGTTTIYNAACEPYIQQLCNMLVNMGAMIEGIGSNLLTIQGAHTLKGTEHTLLPDMIEIGSFIGLAAMTKADLTIQHTASIHHLGIMPSIFKKLGIFFHIGTDYIHIPTQKKYTIHKSFNNTILTITDAIWPGFSPDLLSIALVTAIQAQGTVLIHQRMFESRLFFVDKLIDMGAQIILCDPHRASVIGLNHQSTLKGIHMSSPDIRAGIALLIAALSADGVSIIENSQQIDRGYENIVQRLNALGAHIERINISK